MTNATAMNRRILVCYNGGMDETTPTDGTHRHARWFAVWRWRAWKRITFGALLVMGAIAGLVLWMLYAQFPVDIFIYDTYITVPKFP